MHPFLKHINNYVQLPPEAEEAVVAQLQEEQLDKATVFLKEGQYCKRLYFLVKGTVRTYFFHKGKDITYWIYKDGSMLTAWTSYLKGEASAEYLEATEDAVLYSLSFQQWQQLYQDHPSLERFGRLMMERSIVQIDSFYKGYYFLTAKEKYDLLIAVFPDVTQRANLGHIASLLGISQETLSRIRKG